MVFRLFTLYISLLSLFPSPSYSTNALLGHLLREYSVLRTLLYYPLLDQLDFIVYARGLLKVKCFVLRLGICSHEPNNFVLLLGAVGQSAAV